MTIKKLFFFLVTVFLLDSSVIIAQKTCCTRAIAAGGMQYWKNALTPGEKHVQWNCNLGIVLEGTAATWQQTGDKAYFSFIQNSMDFFVGENGDIKSYTPGEYNINDIKNGTSILWLFRITGKEKYWKAAGILRKQLQNQPRNKTGSFLPAKKSSYLSPGDLYMSLPFYTAYATLAHEDTAFDDIANQFIQMEQYARDPATGLLFTPGDEDSKMIRAGKNSSGFLAIPAGYYAMALVDVLDNFPVTHPKYQELIAILNRTIDAIGKVQDKKTGLWFNVMNRQNIEKNDFSGPAGSMFVYAVAKAVRMGYLPAQKISIAKNGWKGIENKFIQKGKGVAGLCETTGDRKDAGAFLKASAEMDLLPTLAAGAGKTILLDYYFNHETTKDITGATIQHHYTWEEFSNGGYSFLGYIFNSYGVQTKKLLEPVSAAHLRDAAIYFIIDPDWPKENSTPNYIEDKHIEAIYNWVKDGGVLMLFSNDSNNVEFKHYNRLAEKFGIHFNENGPRNLVKGDDYPAGTINIPAANTIFKTAKNIYIKDISSLTLTNPAKAILTDKGDPIIAVSRLGKGTVFAIGDPWLYNEYLDGRKLPATLENFKAAHDLVQWLIKQTR